MALIEINRNPSRRDLWIFAALFALFWVIIAGLFPWRLGAPRVALAIVIADAVIIAAFLMVPALRRPLYLGWIYAVWPIGWTISHLILALIYYLVFTPIGLIMRVFGRDPLHLKRNPGVKTYWIEHSLDDDPARYFRQF